MAPAPVAAADAQVPATPPAPTPITPVAPVAFSAPSAVTPVTAPPAPVAAAPSAFEAPTFASPVEAPKPFADTPPISPAGVPGSAIESGAPVEAPRTFTAPHVIPFDQPMPGSDTAHPLPIDDAPSVGAARLPPLASGPPPPPPPGSGVSITPDGPARRLRLALAGVLVIALAAGVGVLAMGQLGSITGSSSREASEGFSVYEGNGFSLELPDDWEATEEIPGEYDAGFTTPDGAILAISTTEVPPNLDPAARGALTESILKIADVLTPSMTLVSRSPIEVDGTQGELLRREGTLTTQGIPVTDDVVVAFQGTLALVIDLVGPTSAVVGEPLQAEYRQIIASIRFD